MSKLGDRSDTSMGLGITNGLYHSKSPINRGEELSVVEAPDISDEVLEEILEARKRLNKVHSEGYFENYYPETDKSLKQVLHNKAVKGAIKLAAPQGALRDKVQDKERVGSIVININIPER